MSHPNFDRIDFISAYCDRWCDRCAFTTRCSQFAVKVATDMCGGDFAAGVELAVGAPPPTSPEEQRRRDEFLEWISACIPDQAELDEIGREEAARNERIDEDALVTACDRMMLPAFDWLREHRQIASSRSARLAEAVDVIGWDVTLIAAKLHRALHGRDEYLHDDREEDPVQNDWNGSAKVALISIRRSAAAWAIVAEELNDDAAREMAAELRALEREALRAFPDAWRFKRPGFDDPPASVGAGG